MQRRFCPEILDLLPSHHPGVRCSRRDLRRINRFMGNTRWWRRTVAHLVRSSERVLEIGAGDGSSCPLPGARVDGLDRQPPPTDWPPAAGWHCAAAQEFEGWHRYQVLVGNLIFHHFTEEELRMLGARARPHARVIVACEPRRARRFQLGFKVLGHLLGACAVTLHDGHVSIAAGFRGCELPSALGLSGNTEWRWTIHETWRGSYRMIALKSE